MIRIYTYEEINELTNVCSELKKELQTYFQEIAESIGGETWQDYNISDVDSIVVIEDGDTIDVLEELGLMQGNNIPQLLPEFALEVIIGKTEMLKIIWVFGDSNGISMYYPLEQFDEEFDKWVSDYLAE